MSSPHEDESPHSASAGTSPRRKLGVVANFLSLAASSIAGSVLALWATSHLARALGVEGFGAFNLARTLIDYALIPSAFGITITASRTIAKSADGDRALAGRVVMIRAIAGFVGLLALVAIGWLWVSSELTGAALMAMMWAVPLTALSVDWVYSAHEDQRWAGVARTAGRALYAAIIILAVSSPLDIGIAGCALVAEAAFTTLLMWVHARSWIDLSTPVLTDVRGMIAHLGSSMHVGAAGLAVRLKTSADVLVLGVLGTQAALGYYSAGYRLVLFVNSLAGLYGTVLLPRMARARTDGHSAAVLGASFRVTLLIGMAVAAGGASVAGVAVVTLMGPAFVPARAVTTVLMVAAGFVVVSLALGYTAVALGHERQYGRITMGLAAANVVLNVALVPIFGMYGAAATTLGTEVVLTVALGWLLWHEGLLAALSPSWVARWLLCGAITAASAYGVLTLGLGLWLAILVGAMGFIGATITLRLVSSADWNQLSSAMSST